MDKNDGERDRQAQPGDAQDSGQFVAPLLLRDKDACDEQVKSHRAKHEHPIMDIHLLSPLAGTSF